MDKLESTHASLPHGLKALEDTFETLASNLDRVHSQLLLSEETFGNGESLLRELVVGREGGEVLQAEKSALCLRHHLGLYPLVTYHAELGEGFTKSSVCQHHDVLNILTAVLGLEEVDGLSALRRNGGAADLGGRALADTVECESELVLCGLVDLLAALGVVVVDGDVCTEGLDELRKC